MAQSAISRLAQRFPEQFAIGSSPFCSKNLTHPTDLNYNYPEIGISNVIFYRNAEFLKKSQKF